MGIVIKPFILENNEYLSALNHNLLSKSDMKMPFGDSIKFKNFIYTT